jgi:hypothetical protein
MMKSKLLFPLSLCVMLACAAHTFAQGTVLYNASPHWTGTAQQNGHNVCDATTGCPLSGSLSSSQIISGLGYTPAQTPTLSGSLVSGLLADYNFSQGSGTVLQDISGNGNNGTLGTGSNAPTWISNGLQFTGYTAENVALPSALNSALTFIFAVYWSPISTSPGGTVYNVNGYPAFLTSSLGNPGLNFITSLDSESYGVPIIINGSSITRSSNFATGLTVFAFVLGTGSGNLDHLYINGTEYPYVSQASNAGAQPSGNLFLGATPGTLWASSSPQATFYRARIYSTQKSAADILALTQIFRADVASRGVATTPFPTPTGTPTIHCIGDSIQAGYGGTSGAPCATLSLLNQPTYAIENWGISSQKLQQFAASEPNRVGLQCPDAGGAKNIALIEGGVNDIGGASVSAAQTWLYMQLEIQQMKNAGCLVAVMPILSNTGFETQKDAYNALLRTGAIAAGADLIADTAADPVLGADGACSNTTYFQTGCLHPNNTGYAHMASAISNALNYYFGANAASPTVVTATSYTMTAADGYVNIQPTGNTTVTLPDCIGQSGAVYRINMQGAYTLTVKNAVSSEPIDGTDHSSSGLLVLSGAGTVLLRDVANPPATSGCHWDF